VKPGRPGRPVTSHTPKAAAHRRARKRRRRKGLCHQCARTVSVGTLCDAHMVASRRDQRARVLRLLAQGCCRWCSWPSSRGTHLCLTCALKRNRQPSRQAAYRNAREYDQQSKRPQAERKAA